MADPLATFSPTPTSPARKCFTITPSDVSDLPIVPKAIYCCSAGDVTVTLVDGGTETFPVSGPGPLDIGPSRVFATGTTVSKVIGLL